MKAVTILDYGMGNLQSILKKFRRIGADPTVTSNPRELAFAERLVLPGVGHFGAAMENLQACGLKGPLNEAVVGRGVPVLGLCLGMQLFARHSEEGDSPGLGWIDAEVVRFRVGDPILFKVPHMGWNTVDIKKESRLTAGLPPQPEFYFAHSYHLVCREHSDVAAETTYDYSFPAIVAKGSIWGVQFHPEKSHESGEALLRNFMVL